MLIVFFLIEFVSLLFLIIVFILLYICVKRVCSCPQWSVWLRLMHPSLIAVTMMVTRLSTVRRTAATRSLCRSSWTRALIYTPGQWTAGRLCTAPPTGDTLPSHHASCAGGQRSTPRQMVSLQLCSLRRETLQHRRPWSFCCRSAPCRQD